MYSPPPPPPPESDNYHFFFNFFLKPSLSYDEAKDDAEENDVEKGINAVQAAELRKNRIIEIGEIKIKFGDINSSGNLGPRCTWMVFDANLLICHEKNYPFQTA